MNEEPQGRPSLGRLDLIRDALSEGDTFHARVIYEDHVGANGPWELPELELRKLVVGLAKAAPPSDVKPFVEEYIRRFPTRSAPVKIILGTILLEERRPRRALEVLESIGPPALASKAIASARENLRRRADAMIDQGVLELDLDDL